MKNEWDEYADIWDSVALEYSEKAYTELKKYSHLKELRILDFGCGTGLLSERMASSSNEIVALDSSEKMSAILKAKEITGLTVVTNILTGNLITKVPVLQEPFDLIVASSVCGFLPNYRETLELLSSLLKPQGLFIQWDWLKESSKSESGLSKEEVQEALTHSGLANISVSVPFEMNHPEGTMPVLMATGVKQTH